MSVRLPFVPRVRSLTYATYSVRVNRWAAGPEREGGSCWCWPPLRVHKQPRCSARRLFQLYCSRSAVTSCPSPQRRKVLNWESKWDSYVLSSLPTFSQQSQMWINCCSLIQISQRLVNCFDHCTAFVYLSSGKKIGIEITQVIEGPCNPPFGLKEAGTRFFWDCSLKHDRPACIY